jgi:hypothetical protein
MKLMNNPWSQICKPDKDLNVLLADSAHPLSFYWGVDTTNKYLFIYEGSIVHILDHNDLPILSGITLAIAKDGSRSKLLIILNDSRNWEIFFTLCCDLIRSTKQLKNKENATSVILRRLKKWQDLLKRERIRLMSIEEIKGLIGELLFLSGPVAKSFGWDKAISFWKGPEEAPQDFAIHHDSVEVKCKAGDTKQSIRISSLDQLNTQLPNGYLVVYTLATTSETDQKKLTLCSLVNSIRECLLDSDDNTRERFEDLIFLSGYTDNEKYLEYVFSEIGFRSYHITERFPRILTEAVPQGITELAYSIQLSALNEFEGKPNWLNTVP